ncbi:MAG: DUF3810 domain-containing protein [Saprospiraceae bacterium]|nr:DUF3810 domain-containing protein [Candidatus Defluviibacterium haderslevense]
MLKILTKSNRVLFISLVVCLLTFSLGILLKRLPTAQLDDFYTNTLYRGFRFVWDYSVGLLPIPIIYLWFLFIVVGIIRLIYLTVKRRISAIRLLVNLISGLMIHLSWFYLTWGFNYFRSPLIERLPLNLNINKYELRDAYCEITEKITVLKSNLVNSNSNLEGLSDPDLKRILNDQLGLLFNQFKLVDIPNVNCRIIWPGSLLIWASAGVYWPFSGEANIDGGIHRIQVPFTMAHEMCHAKGWTDEGECNFLAYLACDRSKDIEIKYSGNLAYWRYLNSSMWLLDPEWTSFELDQLAETIQSDLKEIRKKMDRYPEVFESLRLLFYDQYLKVNGIRSGIESYSDLVKWIISFERDIVQKPKPTK